MTAKDINKVIKLPIKHSLYRESGTWYHHLKEFPGALFDENGYVVFNTNSEYLNNPALKHKETLHVRKGIISLNEYVFFTQEEKKLLRIFPKESMEETIREIRQVNRIKRNLKHTIYIKKIYDNACLICGEKLHIRENLYYSEVHHIRPLGFPHNGPDILENIICVCPNHHTLLDLGAIKIDLANLRHKVGRNFVKYHNNKIYGNVIK